MRDFLLSHPEINRTFLCKEIKWNKGSMYHWLKGSRNIPEEKSERLEKILIQYGYKP